MPFSCSNQLKEFQPASINFKITRTIKTIAQCKYHTKTNELPVLKTIVVKSKY